MLTKSYRVWTSVVTLICLARRLGPVFIALVLPLCFVSIISLSFLLYITSLAASDPGVAQTDGVASAAFEAIRSFNATGHLMLAGLTQYQRFLIKEIQANALVLKTNLDLRQMLVETFEQIQGQVANAGDGVTGPEVIEVDMEDVE
jgi:hypothetical protein